jgi:hypothetical protein
VTLEMGNVCPNNNDPPKCTFGLIHYLPINVSISLKSTACRLTDQTLRNCDVYFEFCSLIPSEYASSDSNSVLKEDSGFV